MASGLERRQRRGQPRVTRPRDRRSQPPPQGSRGGGSEPVTGELGGRLWAVPLSLHLGVLRGRKAEPLCPEGVHSTNYARQTRKGSRLSASDHPIREALSLGSRALYLFRELLSVHEEVPPYRRLSLCICKMGSRVQLGELWLSGKWATCSRPDHLFSQSESCRPCTLLPGVPPSRWRRTR